MYLATPRRLDSHRGLFTLSEDALCSYRLGSRDSVDEPQGSGEEEEEEDRANTCPCQLMRVHLQAEMFKDITEVRRSQTWTEELAGARHSVPVCQRVAAGQRVGLRGAVPMNTPVPSGVRRGGPLGRAEAGICTIRT